MRLCGQQRRRRGRRGADEGPLRAHRALASRLLPPACVLGLARAATLRLFTDAACASPTGYSLGPFFTDFCLANAGQGAALLACGDGAAVLGVFENDALCRRQTANVSLSVYSCAPLAGSGLEGGFAQLADTTCAAPAPFYTIASYRPSSTPCSGAALLKAATVDGSKCAANSLLNGNGFTTVTADPGGAGPLALCEWGAAANCTNCTYGGGQGALHVDFAGLGVCTPFSLSSPYPSSIGLVITAAAPYPPPPLPQASASASPSSSPASGGNSAGDAAASAARKNVAVALTVLAVLSGLAGLAYYQYNRARSKPGRAGVPQAWGRGRGLSSFGEIYVEGGTSGGNAALAAGYVRSVQAQQALQQQALQPHHAPALQALAALPQR